MYTHTNLQKWGANHYITRIDNLCHYYKSDEFNIFSLSLTFSEVFLSRHDF